MPSHDDPRYLLAWWGLEKVERIVKSPGIPVDRRRANDALNELWGALKRLRWSGLPWDMASEEAKKLSRPAKELKEILKLGTEEKDLNRAQASWALGYLQALPTMLKLGEEVNPGRAVLVFSGKVLSVASHPSAERLKVTRVSFGNVAMTVVTNIKNVKEGEVRAVALLPPADLRGVISWGMFASEPLSLSEGKPYPPYDEGSVGSVVEQIIREAIKIRR